MKRPDTTLIYVLSSISILCCCFGGLGILFALPSYLIANNRLKNASEEADLYDANFFKSMNNAKIFAMIALIINAIYLFYTIYYLSTSDWSVIMEEYRNGFEQYSS